MEIHRQPEVSQNNIWWYLMIPSGFTLSRWHPFFNSGKLSRYGGHSHKGVPYLWNSSRRQARNGHLELFGMRWNLAVLNMGQILLHAYVHIYTYSCISYYRYDIHNCIEIWICIDMIHIIWENCTIQFTNLNLAAIKTKMVSLINIYKPPFPVRSWWGRCSLRR